MCGINRRRQQGASLITAIFLITALAVLAALMTKLTQFGNTKTIKEWYSAQALYAAESAISAAAYDIVDSDDCADRNNINVTVDSKSSAIYSVTCNQPGLGTHDVNLYEITATGTAGNGSYQAQRRIVVQFLPDG
ncbi:hypothetical protein [Thiohalomonas denitrificans]|uniref:MSHA biogenesis protein MshP n=1 Tax=Thiohalomonas denitrificans TaxID=415747 RepID=A0A1G5QUB3_9GAMM|nr:hypothetical protein [Thiohalomonas denitrificans]SCZ65178.1 hypothetical protein SAMN03097708_02801 [Thiohalomonas denitrificans]